MYDQLEIDLTKDAVANASANKVSLIDDDLRTVFNYNLFHYLPPETREIIQKFLMYAAEDSAAPGEAKEGYEFSNPRIFKPKAILEHLQEWRSDFSEWRKQQNRIITSAQ